MQTPCTHPPARLFAWFAYDGVGRTDLCTACCDCGDVLTGAARLPPPGSSGARGPNATAKPNRSSAPNDSLASNGSLAPTDPVLPS
jgi:hypothetical protein